MLVSEILAIKGKVLFTIGPNRPIAEAVEIMNEQDVGSLVVFSRGEMVGMLTFRQVMDELRRLMVEHHQRYLPVMDGTTLLGVVSFHDVAKAVLEEQSFENRMLKNYIRNWPAGEGEE